VVGAVQSCEARNGYALGAIAEAKLRE
jgi:hypothetical protein